MKLNAAQFPQLSTVLAQLKGTHSCCSVPTRTGDEAALCAKLGVINDYTFYALDIEWSSVCPQHWRQSFWAGSFGELPSGPGLGYPYKAGRLPTVEEVADECLVSVEWMLTAVEHDTPAPAGDRAALRAEFLAILRGFSGTEEFYWTR
jgi:hypothetical protein